MVVDSFLVLQTRQAQKLVQGRMAKDDVPGIIGLARFGKMLRTIWSAARADDPWADWWLVKIHDTMDLVAEELTAIQEQVDQTMGMAPGLEVTLGHSVEPARIPLIFLSPYAYRGAALLAAYDKLTLTILTCRHVALVDRDTAQRLIMEGGRLMRRVFSSAVGYKFLGLVRADVELQTARIIEAESIMGKVPADILSKEFRAPLAPPIVTRHSGPGARNSETEASEADEQDGPEMTDDAVTEFSVTASGGPNA
jgi:Domain of unknown function (DUF1845).